MISNYDKLISGTRRRPTDVSERRDINQESESDRGRFIFSSPLRRLQQKAQVYSLEDNAAVRSRLTHSLEVSQVGRYIAQLILKKLKQKSKEPKPNGHEIAFINFVETACLMHDVGNPPFGHLGEFAIQEWFRERAKVCAKMAGIECDKNAELLEKYIEEFAYFDGNCQGLRIVTRLQWNNDEYGLNLTYSQLVAYLKYVTHQSEASDDIEIKKKGGYFLTEEGIVKECWDKLGMVEHTRHPLVYIMEAADDIAYSISDIEDALEKGLIQLIPFLDIVSGAVATEKQKRSKTGKEIRKLVKKIKGYATNNHLSPFIDFRTALTRLLANYAAEKYISNHSDYMNGISPPIFPEKCEDIEAAVLEKIKKFAINNIYRTAAAADNELAGYSILRGILNHFEPLLSCNRKTIQHLKGKKLENDDEKYKANKLQKRLFALLPKRYLKVYENGINDLVENESQSDLKEWAQRAHLITDYVSGMTDDFALETFQLLSGIKVGKTNLTK